MLKRLRSEIDKLDDKLLELLEHRFDLAHKTSKYKDRVMDKKREAEILLRLCEKLNKFKYLDKVFLKKIYKLIFLNSKSKQK